MITDFIPGCVSHARHAAHARRPSGELADRRRSHSQHKHRHKLGPQFDPEGYRLSGSSSRQLRSRILATAPTGRSMSFPGPASRGTTKPNSSQALAISIKQTIELNLRRPHARFAYYGSLNGNRSNLGLETPVSQIYHDAENGFGGFGSLMYNADPEGPTSLRHVSCAATTIKSLTIPTRTTPKITQFQPAGCATTSTKPTASPFFPGFTHSTPMPF